VTEKASREKKPGLTWKENQELRQLEKDLDQLEKEKSAIESSFSDSTLSPEQLINNSERLGKIIQEIDKKSDRWIELSENAL
jgi:ATP-binding cassette subfamily F protein uup